MRYVLNWFIRTVLHVPRAWRMYRLPVSADMRRSGRNTRRESARLSWGSARQMLVCKYPSRRWAHEQEKALLGTRGFVHPDDLDPEIYQMLKDAGALE